jgi:predicted Zn-dependent peptidase
MAGLAHLCEHLMFSGTKAVPGSYFAPFEQAGAAWMNAYVKEDYSAYFVTVPADALDVALSMEADRMANLADALDDRKIDLQRQVVANELREREGGPFGAANSIIAESMHPRGHPYAHPPDGLASDLDNISPDAVREWVLTRHIPANAIVAIAGAIRSCEATELARRHFQTIPPRTPHPRPSPLLGECHPAPRRQIELAAPVGRICFAWIGPAFDSPDYAAWRIAFEILASGDRSRLRRSPEARKVASDITLQLHPRELGSLAVLSLTAQRGVPLAAIEATVRPAIEQFALLGPGGDELDIGRLRLIGSLLRDFERVGGRPSKSDTLGQATLVGGTADLHDRHLSLIVGMEPGVVAAAARRWITPGCGVLEIYARS